MALGEPSLPVQVQEPELVNGCLSRGSRYPKAPSSSTLEPLDGVGEP